MGKILQEYEARIVQNTLDQAERLWMLYGESVIKLDPVCGNCKGVGKVAEWVPGNGNVWIDCPYCKSEAVKSKG